MNNQKNWIYYVFLAGGLLLFAGSLWFSFSLNKNSNQAQRIALVSRETGQVSILRNNFTRRDKVEKLSPIYSLDSIETNETGEAVLFFENQFKVRIQDSSLVTVEKQDKEAAVIIIKKGDLQVISVGRKQELYIAKNGKRIEAQDYTNSELEISSATSPVGTPEPKLSSSLSDEEISSVLNGQTAAFRKCYAQLLQKDEKAQGMATLNFTIENNGKISSLVIDSDKLNSEEFKKCLSDIAERLSFRAYPGTKISTRYPLKFD